MKAVITCAGVGTRLLPFTKELPKEMAPVFYQTEKGIQMKPLIQLIFENLFDTGIREFCFVTGKTKRAIENQMAALEQEDKVIWFAAALILIKISFAFILIF